MYFSDLLLIFPLRAEHSQQIVKESFSLLSRSEHFSNAKRMIVRLIVIAWSLLFVSHGLKILVYQTALSRSHLMYSGGLVDILVDARHEVHKLIANWNPTISDNGTKKATSVYRFTLSKPSPWLKINHFSEPFEAKVINYHMDSREAALHWQTIAEFCKEMLADEKLLHWLQNSNFDIAISTTYDFCVFGLFHVAKIKPVIGFLVTPISDIVLYALGISNPASYTQDSFYPSDNGDQMTYLQRVNNLYTRTLMQQIYIPRFIAMQDEIFHGKFGKRMPSLQTLFSQMSYIFVNAHPLVDYPRPLSHKLIFIGGIQLNDAGQLPQEFDRVLSMRPDGAVLVSFGSTALTSKMPKNLKRIFLEVFAAFPQLTFFWKFDEPHDKSSFTNISNVYMAKWLPQKQLLGDKRMKAFITHVGLNSLMESIHEGVPLVGIPLFADQLHNAGIIRKRQIGIVIDKRNITVENLRNSLNDVLYNDRYRQTAKMLSAMIRKNPNNPTKTFLKYVEFTAQFPNVGEYLQLQSTNLSSVEYFCIDIIVPFIFIAITLLYFCFKALLIILAKCMQREAKDKFE
ncbi:Putative UDP-glucuronosyltransferase ugt-47 [Toxocara canis]|uniref:glucuronosyltransferase n=1 Tax=Toxocara canis TaxID=6265 RepID=A0A0B2V9G9_TOXCA|nr:Putative UDP-glucuronosyltransferase ugt-47 [Toxocara canis]